MASAAYDTANEQTQFAGASLTYDANGNLTNDGVNTYQWDARNRLIGIIGGTTSNFAYDSLGRRTSKAINSVAAQFLYDGNDIVAEIGGGAVGANYFHSLNIDEPFIRQTGTGNEHYHTDALGSSLALSNAAGGAATTYTYEPFGKTTVSGASSNAFQYTGRENDNGDVHYYRRRYYSSRSHRFISNDPSGFEGGFNFYLYVLNNPLTRVDPFGLKAGDPFISPDGAAKDVMTEICSKPTSSLGNEWGGYIYQGTDGMFYASKPRTDGLPGSVDPRTPSGPHVKAEYHTHRIGGSSDFTLPNDYRDSRNAPPRLFTNYLGLPGEDCRGKAFVPYAGKEEQINNPLGNGRVLDLR